MIFQNTFLLTYKAVGMHCIMFDDLFFVSDTILIVQSSWPFKLTPRLVFQFLPAPYFPISPLPPTLPEMTTRPDPELLYSKPLLRNELLMEDKSPLPPWSLRDPVNSNLVATCDSWFCSVILQQSQTWAESRPLARSSQCARWVPNNRPGMPALEQGTRTEREAAKSDPCSSPWCREKGAGQRSGEQTCSGKQCSASTVECL